MKKISIPKSASFILNRFVYFHAVLNTTVLTGDKMLFLCTPGKDFHYYKDYVSLSVINFPLNCETGRRLEKALILLLIHVPTREGEKDLMLSRVIHPEFELD